MASLNISQIRSDYQKKELSEEILDKNPLIQLQIWIDEAIKALVNEPTAMNVSSVSKSCRPSSRILLLKDIDAKGLTFFTNYSSRKGIEFNDNPYAAINFFWPELERQVRIEGKVEKVSNEISDEYFGSRPRGSQIGAHISSQSNTIPDRTFLEERQKKLELEYENKSIARPTHWGGYQLIPDSFEFWQGRPNRLHDRILYSLNNEGWVMARLAP